MNHFAWLLAASPTRTTFEWGRVETSTDWLLPLGVTALLITFVIYMYRKDSVELRLPIAVLLTTLRITAILGVLLIYLQPQWRNESDHVANSRVVLLMDTSLSMGLQDNDDSTPVPADPSRAQRVITALADSRFLDDLRKKHDVVLARFDQETGRVDTLNKFTPEELEQFTQSGGKAGPKTEFKWAEALAARGAETRLGQALRQMLLEERTQPVSALVLVSDGQQNAGPEPTSVLPLARDIGIPIYTIGIGSDRQNINVRISDFVAPARAYPGDKYTATGYLQAQGMPGQTVTVELLSSEASTGGRIDEKSAKVEATEQVTLGPDGEVTPVKFELVPDVVGRKTLRLRVIPPPRDAYAGDDQQEVDIEIVDRKTKVLLFAGGPSREYQFLRNQLRRDKEIVVDVLLQTGSEGVSQDANEILDEFPTTREELFEYDCIVAFDPNWTELAATQIDALDRWVSEQAGGLIVIAGPIYTDELQAASMAKIRDLYPVVFQKRLTSIDDGRYGAKEAWPIEFTQDGKDAEFLMIEDSPPASAEAWGDFHGVYGYYAVEGNKPGATVYARFSDPQTRDRDKQPVYMAAQFFGAGRVFYMGSGEMWRLRSVDEAYFERFYTKLIRYVSQGRLLRGSNRGVLLVERDRYVLGNTVAVRAQLSNAQLDPLVAPQVSLQVFAPDSTQQTVNLLADAARPGNFAGQFTVRVEGAYRLELPVPDAAEERLTRRIQVKVPDLERENPQRNDKLLRELADKTGGKAFVGLQEAIGDGTAEAPLVTMLRDRSRTTIKLDQPNRLWDNWWVLATICGLLCTEWLVRRLVRLA